MEDYYSVLGVARDASQEEIQDAYREKAKEYHPDISDHDDAEERFKRVKKAYETLSDGSNRRQYDRLGHRNYEQADKHGATGDGGPGGAGMGGFGGDFSGVGGFGGMEDVFDAFFGGGMGRGGRGRGVSRGRDLRTSTTIDLEDAYRGTETRVTYIRTTSCPECGGSGAASEDAVSTCPECSGSGQQRRIRNTPQGRVMTQRTCTRCRGEGRVVEESCEECGGEGRVDSRESVEVDIPPGVGDGQVVRIRGKGQAGERGGPSGDLHVEIRVQNRTDLARDGDDLLYEHEITFPRAVFGDTVEVPHFDGALNVEVPPGTRSGDTLRLRGKGMPRLRGHGSGDLHVKVQVVTPDPGELDGDALEALQQFSESTDHDFQPDQGLLDRFREKVLR